MLNFNAELKNWVLNFLSSVFENVNKRKIKKRRKNREKTNLQEATWAGPTEPHLRQHLPVRLPKKKSPQEPSAGRRNLSSAAVLPAHPPPEPGGLWFSALVPPSLQLPASCLERLDCLRASARSPRLRRAAVGGGAEGEGVGEASTEAIASRTVDFIR